MTRTRAAAVSTSVLAILSRVVGTSRKKKTHTRTWRVLFTSDLTATGRPYHNVKRTVTDDKILSFYSRDVSQLARSDLHIGFLFLFPPTVLPSLTHETCVFATSIHSSSQRVASSLLLLLLRVDTTPSATYFWSVLSTIYRPRAAHVDVLLLVVPFSSFPKIGFL